MIDPLPAASIWRPALRHTRKVPVRFTSSTRRQPFSVGTSSGAAPQNVAALLMTTSIDPNSAPTVETSRSTSSSIETSTPRARAFTP